MEQPKSRRKFDLTEAKLDDENWNEQRSENNKSVGLTWTQKLACSDGNKVSMEISTRRKPAHRRKVYAKPGSQDTEKARKRR
jgi:hypothetical protein